MRKLTLLWILLFISQIIAQNKPIALKFDEFSYPRNPYNYFLYTFNYEYKSEKINFNDRVIRFAQEVSKQSNSTAYIIFYNQRKGKYPLDKGKTEGQNAIRILTNQSEYAWHPNPKYPISPNRVISIDGGYREEPTLEFWIVPQNAELPKPTPTVNPAEIVVCPEINIAGDGFRKERTQPLKFSVVLNGEEPNSKYGLEWNVSAGKIIKGQGTSQIEVDLTETNANLISASVQVKGLHPECDNQNFVSTRFGSYPIKMDEMGHFNPSDFSSRLDNLTISIREEPNLNGYIIIYGNRDENKKDVLKLTKIIQQIIFFRKFPENKIKVVNGGYREELSLELFVVPDGVEPPKPTPTVDEKFIAPPKKVEKKRRKISK